MSHNAADRELIIEVVAKYARGYDEADFALLADAFAETATSSGKVSGTDVTWGPMNGRDEIISVLRGLRESQSDQRRHVMSNFLFSEQTDKSARLRCYLTLFAAENGAAQFVTGGSCDMEMAKDAAGGWRLARMDVTLDAPY